MEYTVEDLSPVKKKITISVPAEEVNAALMASVVLYKRQADIKGFRKGKVPTSLVESRYKKEIYSEATTDLINAQINEIIGEKNLTPLSRIDVDAGLLVKDQPFEYSLSFEVKPDFDLPEYTGLKVSEEKVEIKESDVQEVIDRLRKNLAVPTPVTEVRHPQDGDIAVITFHTFKDGEELKDITADNFEMPIGEGQALEDFENMVKGLKPGETTEGEVTFPEDFLNKEMAGHTVTMKVTLHAIKERKLPEVDDEFAKKAGGFESVDQLREAIEKSYIESRTQVIRSATQKKLLDQLTSKLDFPLPETMLNGQIQAMVEDRKDRLERKGKSLESTGTTEDQLREEVKPLAEDIVRSQLVLLDIADEEDIKVTPQEVDMYLQQMSMRTGQDYNTLRDYHERNNLMFAIKDKLLADKAMDFLYEHAEIEQAAPSEVNAKSETESPKGE
ncbi:MAG: trigger factor [Desulfovibrionales bacterium]